MLPARARLANRRTTLRTHPISSECWHCGRPGQWYYPPAFCDHCAAIDGLDEQYSADIDYYMSQADPHDQERSAIQAERWSTNEQPRPTPE